MKVLVDQALTNSGNADLYCSRMRSYPNLTKFGCLPENINEISHDESPWFCHGLAFRMATYFDTSDDMFCRLETLLEIAQKANGWCHEYAHWSNANDHWAKKHDKFNQFLWLLQCYEYFTERGHVVSFPATGNSKAMPDLFIEREGQEGLYAECFCYAKWWPREEYLKQLLRKIDINLSIKRTHNIPYKASDNPFYSDDQFNIALEHVAAELTPNRLHELQVAAQCTYPQKVCEIGAFEILLEGSGQYQSSVNAHGDPDYSWPVFVEEIIKAKKCANNLIGSRPNIVMVNALGLDFQFSLPNNRDQGPAIAELPPSLDEVWISACGIDEKLETCQRGPKILRNGYAGSGFCTL